MLLETRITKDDGYQKQQGVLNERNTKLKLKRDRNTDRVDRVVRH